MHGQLDAQKRAKNLGMMNGCGILQRQSMALSGVHIIFEDFADDAKCSSCRDHSWCTTRTRMHFVVPVIGKKELSCNLDTLIFGQPMHASSFTREKRKAKKSF